MDRRTQAGRQIDTLELLVKHDGCSNTGESEEQIIRNKWTAVKAAQMKSALKQCLTIYKAGLSASLFRREPIPVGEIIITRSYLQSVEQYVQKTRRLFKTSLDSATVIQLHAALMALMQTYTSTLYSGSNAPADGTTHSTEAKGNNTTELSPWTQELQPVWWGQGYENMHRFSWSKTSWPPCPASTAFPHCDWLAWAHMCRCGGQQLDSHPSKICYFFIHLKQLASTSLK